MSISLPTPPPSLVGKFVVESVIADPDNPGHVCVTCKTGSTDCCNCDIRVPIRDIQNFIALKDGTLIFSNSASFTVNSEGIITGVSGHGDVSTSTGECFPFIHTDDNGNSYYNLTDIDKINMDIVRMDAPSNHNELGW